MKRHSILSLYAFALASILGLSQCRDRDSEEVSQVVRVQFPKITLAGDAVVAIPVGGSFTDPGATVEDSLADPISRQLTSISNNIDASRPGFYSATYRAINKFGFETTVARLVLVSEADSAKDLSGVYRRTTNQGPVYVTKVSTGLYRVFNPGGIPDTSSPVATTVFMGNPTGNVISIPGQITPEVDQIDCTGETYTPAPDGSDGAGSKLSWVVVNSNYGTAVRTFVKQ